MYVGLVLIIDIILKSTSVMIASSEMQVNVKFTSSLFVFFLTEVLNYPSITMRNWKEQLLSTLGKTLLGAKHLVGA